MSYPQGFGPQGAPSPETLRVQDAARPLFEAKGWMKLLGVLSIVGGAMYALTIVGIIFAWLPIWIGILLWKSAKAAEDAHVTGSAEQFLASQAKLKTFFTIYGVITLIGLVIAVIAIILVGGAIITEVRQGFSV